MQQFKLKQEKAAKGESFKTAFPLYYQMLALYSDSRLFRSDSADKILPKSNKLFENISAIEPNNKKRASIQISYMETEAPNNFDHQVRPFQKKQSNELLKIAQKYNSISFAPPENPIKSLEHGNYRLFGLNKNRIGKPNKFISTQKSFFNTTASTSHNISTRLSNQRNRLLGMSAAPVSTRSDIYRDQFSKKNHSLIKQLGLQQEYAISFAKHR